MTLRLAIGTLFSAAFVLTPGALYAVTATPSITAWGWDDTNISTLNPYLAPYVTTCPWLAPSLPNSGNTDNVGWAFNDPAQWLFRFAANVEGLSTVGPNTVQSFTYSAWVVNNDGYNLPNGAAAQPVTTTGDVGGANYTLLYVPGANDPGGASSATALANVHFFQFVRTITTFGGAPETPTSTVTRYFVDNNGSAATPFYDQVFSSGYSGAGNINKWIDDTPFRCENQDPAATTCRSDGVPSLLNIDWEAQTFIAVDRGVNLDLNTQHDVILYGGRWWGFIYSNHDLPEPSSLALAALGIGLLAFRARRLPWRTHPCVPCRDSSRHLESGH